MTNGDVCPVSFCKNRVTYFLWCTFKVLPNKGWLTLKGENLRDHSFYIIFKASQEKPAEPTALCSAFSENGSPPRLPE